MLFSRLFNKLHGPTLPKRADFSHLLCQIKKMGALFFHERQLPYNMHVLPFFAPPSPPPSTHPPLQVEDGTGEGSRLLSVPSGRCVTAGWPFFTGAAFEMNKESKSRHGKDYAVVLLNEAEEPVEYDLSFPSEGFTVKAMIGPRSIQTVLA